MKTLKIILNILFLSLIACQKKDNSLEYLANEDSTLTKLKTLWSIPISDDGKHYWINTSNPRSEPDTINYNGNIIVPFRRDGVFSYKMVNSTNGETIWEYSTPQKLDR